VNNLSTVALMFLVMLFFVNSIVVDCLTIKELRRHNAKMESISEAYKVKSIEVSEQFNKEIKALGER